MKITNKGIFVLSLMLLMIGGCAKTSKNVLLTGNINNNMVVSSLSGVSEQEEKGLIQMREEEKLARDVYKKLGEKWGNQVFINIAQSEQTHTDAIKILLDRYMIKDPVVDDTVGSFTSLEIKKLYEDLVVQGNKSLLDAFIVGATIEDLDINDLNKLTHETNNEDIKFVYNNLNKGSRNHINAFVKNIINNGGSYAPKYISQTEYDEILLSQQGNNGNGNGNGNKR